MRIGAFELSEPLPELREPQVLAILRPWVDVCNVGSLALLRLEQDLEAKPLGRLARPGNFFDFTRYRPALFMKEDKREIALPNSTISYAHRPQPPDFLFLHLLEPHHFAEDYVESIQELIEKFGAKLYGLLGAMYDLQPHTRPLLVTGACTRAEMDEKLKSHKVKASTYQGPTTILALIAYEAQKRGIDSFTLIVHLPQYTQLDEDYSGLFTLLQLLRSLYELPLNLDDIAQKARNQYDEVSKAIEANPQAREMVRQLELFYEARVEKEEPSSPGKLSPEIERFLRDISRGLGQG